MEEVVSVLLLRGSIACILVVFLKSGLFFVFVVVRFGELLI